MVILLLWCCYLWFRQWRQWQAYFCRLLFLLTARFSSPLPSKEFHPCTHIDTAPPPVSTARNARKPQWVRDEIIRLKAWMPQCGYTKIADNFNRLFADQLITIGRTCVGTIILKSAYEIAQVRNEWRKHPPGLSPSNRTWAIDLTGKGDSDGNIHYIFAIVDEGTRRALCLRHVLHKSSIVLLGYIIITIGLYGLPKVIKTDNEAIFTSRLFTSTLRLLGIRHCRSTLGHPWENGYIERFFGTLKQTLDKITIHSTIDLRFVLAHFELWYNAIRPHQHLAGRTPLEAWQGVDPKTAPTKEVVPFRALNGLLSGFYIRRQ